MSSRQEEKEKRRAEREAQEAAAAKAAARSKRVQIVLGAVLVLAILAGSTFALVSGGDSGSSGKVQDGPSPKAAVPPVVQTDLVKAAAAAGCVLVNPPNEGSTHVSGKVNYKANPPTSGNHNPNPAPDGIYAPGNEPAKENFVHTLEHGRIEIQYAPGTSKKVIAQLETVGNEKFNGTAGYHVLVFENNTQMPYAVAATAWDHYVGCKTMNQKVFDAIRAFRAKYTDKAPELIP